MLTVSVEDTAGTRAVAQAIANLARPGDIIVLAGEMGAGKTRFAQGFGAALGVTEPITSPTFTLVHSYPIDRHRTLHHADLYRLDHTGDVADLALDELAEFGGIILVEWGDIAAAGLGDHLEVRLEPDGPDADPTSADDDDFGLDEPRTIFISAVGNRWAGRWDRLVDVTKRLAPDTGGATC